MESGLVPGFQYFASKVGCPAFRACWAAVAALARPAPPRTPAGACPHRTPAAPQWRVRSCQPAQAATPFDPSPRPHVTLCPAAGAAGPQRRGGDPAAARAVRVRAAGAGEDEGATGGCWGGECLPACCCVPAARQGDCLPACLLLRAGCPGIAAAAACRLPSCSVAMASVRMQAAGCAGKGASGCVAALTRQPRAASPHWLRRLCRRRLNSAPYPAPGPPPAPLPTQTADQEHPGRRRVRQQGVSWQCRSSVALQHQAGISSSPDGA